MQIHNAIITGSFSYNGADLSNVTSSNAYSASLSSRTTNLESTSSVLVGASSSFSSVLSSVSSSQQQLSSSLLQVSASYISLSGSYNTFSGSASIRVTQIEQVYATTGSNSFRANQSITGSLVVSSTITAQTLVVQTVTSSIVYSSGSNIFGNAIGNTQTFTGSVNITGSSHAIFGNVGIGTSLPGTLLQLEKSSFPEQRITDGTIGFQMYSSTGGGEFVQGTYSNHPLIFRTNAAERLRITNTGAIGIGTTNPNSFFEAYANCTTNLAYFTTSGSANRMIIGATNLGNGALIDVRAHGSTYTESIFGMCVTNTVAVIGAPASGCAMLVGTGVNSPLVFGTCNAERLRITNTGAATFACGVSVNGLATSANYKLGATGAAFISGTNSKGVFITDSATYASIVGLNSAISTYNKLELRASGLDGQIMLHTNGNVSIGNPSDTGDQLYLAGNLKMITNGKIDSNGGYLAINSATGVSVGIGSTPANAKLLVYDTGCTVSLGISCFYNQARGIDLFNANSATTDNVVGLWISTGPHKAGIASGRTNAASTWEVDLRFYTHPTTIGSLDSTCENMRLYGDGSLVTRGATSTPGLYSDINLKENLSIIPSALNKIQCINGYTFDWKDTAPSRRNPSLLNIIHDAGLIAQEVENILPDIVRNNDLSCTKMLNYNGITALLVEGMKEQQCTICSQASIINTLKTCLGII